MRRTLSPAARVTQLLQLAKQPLGDQKLSDALLEMRALAWLPPTVKREPRHINLLCALWLQCLQETICTVIPNAEEMDDAALQQMADHLNDVHTAATTPIHAAPLVPAFQNKQEDVVTAAVKPPQNRWTT